MKKENRQKLEGRFVFRSLPARLSAYISCVLLVAVVFGVGSLSYFWLTGLSKALSDGSVTSAKESAASVDRVLAQIEQTATLLATSLENRRETKDSLLNTVRLFLETANSICPETTSISVAFTDGALVLDERFNMITGIIRGDEGVSVACDGEFDYFQRPWFVAAVELKKPIWTTPYSPEVVDGDTIISFVVPFFKKSADEYAESLSVEEREVAGVVLVDAPVDAFYRYLPSKMNFITEELAKKSGVFLTNQFGRFIVAPGDAVERQATIFTVCDEAPVPDPNDRAAARRLLFEPLKSGGIQLRAAPLLESASDVYYARCVNGWVVGVAIPSDWIGIVLRPLIWRIALATLAALTAIVAIVFIVCRRLNRPLAALASAAEAVGVGDFSAPLPKTVEGDEVGRVAKSFEKMRVDLTKYIAELEDSVAARERSEGELNAAKAIQSDLLPHILPPFDEFDNVRGAARLIPARGVGGDLYDVFPIGEDLLAFIVGDVSGKGVPAALFMAVTQTLQRSVATTESAPGALTSRLNALLSVNNASSMFVTYWIGVLNIRSGLLRYCCGGHNPPVLKRADGTCDYLRTRNGPPLGIVPGREYDDAELQLKDGDAIVLYTDGVTEAFNADGDMFGENRLLETVSNSVTATPKELLNELEKSVADFVGDAPQSDDLTALIVQLRSDKTTRRELTVKASVDNLNLALNFVRRSNSFEKLDVSARKRLILAVEEVFVNVANYAYLGQTGLVEVAAWEEDNKIFVSFSDFGDAFNPLETNAPDVAADCDARKVGGLGVFLVKKSVDFLDYRRENGKNVLTLGKKIDAETR